MKLTLLTLLFILNLCAFSVLADTFVVINNNDSGTGSLREALIKANTNPGNDLISFNISGNTEDSRTITLLSQLPVITEGLTIDGTTQPGNPFGRSKAKIIIQPAPNITPQNLFVIKNVDGISFYGLYVRDFRGTLPLTTFQAAFIYAENVKNLQIGAPDKGNVITNCGQLIITSDYAIPNGQVQLDLGIENMKIKSNFIGFEPDGKSVRSSPAGLSGGAWLVLSKGTFEIGGDDDSERNYFANSANYFRMFYSQSRSRFYEMNFVVKNNYFDFDIDGEPRPLISSEINDQYLVLYQYFTGDLYPPLPGSATILNNKSLSRNSVQMYNLTGPIKFQGNQFLPHPNVIYNNYNAHIRLTSADAVLLGGEQPKEPNTIYNMRVLISSTKSAIATQNSIYCNIASKDQDVLLVSGDKLPKVSITSETSTLVSGTATPGAKVELFYDDDCITCHPQTYFKTVVADANGNWSQSGNFSKGIIASATYNNFTSAYTRFIFNYNLKVKPATCNESNGSISGLNVENAINFSWTNERNEEVGTTQDISGLKPGKYKLTVKNISCSKTSDEIEIRDLTPRINDRYFTKIEPSCSKLGAINNLILPYEYEYTLSWTNQLGEKVSGQLNPQNLPSGSYMLSIKYKEECEVRYGPVILQSTVNPSVLTEADVKVENTICNKSTGSVSGLKVSGASNITYRWIDDMGKTVGTSLSLTNVGAGKYFLEIKNPTDCSVVYSSKFDVLESNGILLNSDAIKITKSSCSLQNGGIEGITVDGATTFRWLNEKDETVSSQLLLNQMPAGKYKLEVANGFCTKTTPYYEILQLPGLIDVSIFKFNARHASCGLKNGAIEAVVNQTGYLPKSYYWANDQGAILRNENNISGLAPGRYSLFGVDENNCVVLIGTQEIIAVKPLLIEDSDIENNAATCQQSNGSISGITISGGTRPYAYQWFDSDHQLVGQNLNIALLKAGSYELKVTDANLCTMITKSFVITERSLSVNVPVITPVTLCSAAEAQIIINNFETDSEYRLYNSQYAVEPIRIITDQKFTQFLAPDKSFYLSKRTGSCESERVAVEVHFGMLATAIPSGFTPNGDNQNDKWEIKGIENYPNARVQIFTRAGTRIFESVGYKTAFDGTYKNTPLGVGVYYYTINFGSDCKQISGSLMLIR